MSNEEYTESEDVRKLHEAVEGLEILQPALVASAAEISEAHKNYVTSSREVLMSALGDENVERRRLGDRIITSLLRRGIIEPDEDSTTHFTSEGSIPTDLYFRRRVDNTNIPLLVGPFYGEDAEEVVLRVKNAEALDVTIADLSRLVDADEDCRQEGMKILKSGVPEDMPFIEVITPGLPYNYQPEMRRELVGIRAYPGQLYDYVSVWALTNNEITETYGNGEYSTPTTQELRRKIPGYGNVQEENIPVRVVYEGESDKIFLVAKRKLVEDALS